MSEDQNVVYVGRKPVMSYVLAIITYLNTPDAKEVVLNARGRAITTAVDVAEITGRKFMEKLKISGIDIGTEELKQEDGRTRVVSTIEITLFIYDIQTLIKQTSQANPSSIMDGLVTHFFYFYNVRNNSSAR
jgi:DNA-binding protein